MTQNDIQRSLGRLEGKVDSLINDVKVIRKGAEHKIDELDTRVHKLEKRQFAVIVIASGLFTASLAFFKRFI